MRSCAKICKASHGNAPRTIASLCIVEQIKAKCMIKTKSYAVLQCIATQSKADLSKAVAWLCAAEQNGAYQSKAID